MKTFSTIIDDALASPALENTFEQIKNELGAPFVPHFFKVWGDAPEALQGVVPAMKHILGGGELDRRLKEMIMVAISSSKDCTYCEAAHQVFCSMMGGVPSQIESLLTTHTLPESDNAKDKAAIDFAVQLANNPKSSSNENLEKLKGLGYTQTEILEIIAMSGMAVFYNHLADATQIIIDKGFTDVLSKPAMISAS